MGFFDDLGESKSAPTAAPQQPQSGGGGGGFFSDLKGTVTTEAQPQAAPDFFQNFQFNNVEPYMDPAGRMPANNFGDLANNAVGDVADSLQGLSALSSAAWLRAGQSVLPKGLWQQDRWEQDPVDAMMPMQWLRPGDTEALQQIGTGVVDHYAKNWVGPIAQAAGSALSGDTSSALQSLQRPWDYMRTRPVSGLLDVMPVADALNVPNMMGKLAKGAASKTPVLGQMVAENEAARAAGQLARDEHNAYMAELYKQKAEMNRLYERVNPALKEHLLGTGEAIDPEMAAAMRQADPAVGEFLDAADRFNKLNGAKLRNLGAMTGLEEQMAQWGPAIRAEAERLGIPLHEADLTNPNMQGYVQTLRQTLDAQGVKPTYFGRVRPSEVKRAEIQARGLFEGTPIGIRKIANEAAEAPTTQAAKQVVEDSANKPGFMRQRTSDDGRVPGYHDEDALRTWTTRTVQGLQFVHYVKFINRMMKISEDVISKYPNVAKDAVDIKTFMLQLTKASQMSPEAANAFMEGLGGGQVLMPKAMASALVKYTNKRDPWRIPLDAVPGFAGKEINFTKLNAIFKTFTLGLDAGWGVIQSIQGGMIAGLSMMRHPQEVASHMLAFKLAFDSNVTKKLPPGMFSDVAHAEGDGANLVGALEKYGRAGAVVQGYMNGIFGMVTASENYWRSVIALDTLMIEAGKLSPAGQRAWHQALDIMTAQQQVFTALDNPQVVKAATDRVLKWMGDYGPIARNEMGALGEVFPFVLWYRHALSLADAMFWETPGNNSLLNAIFQSAPPALQDQLLTEREKERGAVLIKDGNNIPITGPNGGYMSHTNSGLTPLSQTPQLMLAAASGAMNRHEPIEGLLLSPLIQYVTNFFGINMQSGKMFNNPHSLSVSGQKFENNTDNIQKIERQGLPVENYLMQPIFPRIAQTLKQINAGPYKPTDQTSVLPFGDAAVARNFQGDPIKALPPFQQFVLGTTKLTLTEQQIDINAEDQMNAREEKRVLRAAGKQDFRTDRDPSVLERTLQGYVSNEGME